MGKKFLDGTTERNLKNINDQRDYVTSKHKITPDRLTWLKNQSTIVI